MTRLALLFTLLTSTVAANATNWNVDPGASTLGFSGMYQGEAFNGTFSRFAATIVFDPADLPRASFDVRVDVSSAATGNGDYDAQLASVEFFDYAKFPQAQFTTDAFHDGDDGLVAEGKLRIRDKSVPVTLKLVFKSNSKGATLDVDSVLKRLDFDIGTGDWADTSLIANEVPVHAHLVLKPKSGD